MSLLDTKLERLLHACGRIELAALDAVQVSSVDVKRKRPARAFVDHAVDGVRQKSDGTSRTNRLLALSLETAAAAKPEDVVLFTVHAGNNGPRTVVVRLRAPAGKPRYGHKPQAAIRLLMQNGNAEALAGIALIELRRAP